MTQLVVITAVFALLGVVLAFVRRLRGWSCFLASLIISVVGFLVVSWRDLPFGATLATPEGPGAVAIYHLVPFLVFYFAPLQIGYFVTRAIRSRGSARA